MTPEKWLILSGAIGKTGLSRSYWTNDIYTYDICGAYTLHTSGAYRNGSPRDDLGYISWDGRGYDDRAYALCVED